MVQSSVRLVLSNTGAVIVVEYNVKLAILDVFVFGLIRVIAVTRNVTIMGIKFVCKANVFFILSIPVLLFIV